MKMLVTGGCGFIGTNFIYHILEKHPDYQIINLDKLTYAGNRENLERIEKDPKHKPRYTFVQGDICDIKLVEKLVEKVDIIVHFAAESHVDRSIEKSDVFVKTNVLGTHALLEAARIHNKRFHQISTDEVFGSLGKTGKFNEKTPYSPRSPYSASKAAADHLAMAYYHTHGLAVTISNCSNNYGPYQFPEKLIPLFITNLMEGKKVPLYGDGMNIRDWLFVKDHCKAIDLIIHKGKIGETYCVGGDCEKTNKEITYSLLKAFGKGEESIDFVPDRKGHDGRYAIDNSKLQKELGWKPKVTFEQGMKLTIQWYKDNVSWWKKLKQRK